MINCKIYWMFVLMMIGILIIPVQAADAIGSTITVNDSGGADYTRIQDAIDNASDGDLILVYSGTYYEHLFINKNNLTLIGENRNNVILDGGGVGSVVLVMNFLKKKALMHDRMVTINYV